MASVSFISILSYSIICILELAETVYVLMQIYFLYLGVRSSDKYLWSKLLLIFNYTVFVPGTQPQLTRAMDFVQLFIFTTFHDVFICWP